MAVVLSDKLVRELEDVIGDVSRVRRIVVDIQVGHAPIIHIERYGDEKLVNVIRALEGIKVERVELSEVNDG